jgi:drug/metabolite transporter (DMT)-like permease
MPNQNPRTKAILQAILVTTIWSSSWLIIKFFIHEIPPFTFAAMRYGIAFLLLLPGLIRNRLELRTASKTELRAMVGLGLLYYCFLAGGQFLVLKVLESTTFSLMLNFTTPIVAVVGMYWLKERLTPRQWWGMAVFLLGALLYFYQRVHVSGQTAGIILAGVIVLVNAGSSLLGRFVNREQRLSPITVTAFSMGVGSSVLVAVALAWEGLPRLSAQAWMAIAWLAAVNTAFAFWLWNTSLRMLSAMESSMINNTMLVQIAFLSYIFLNERISLVQVLGLGLAMAGVVLVSLRK